MRESYTDQNPALLSGCMPYAYAGLQHDPLPVQRFSISEVQSDAGNPMYLPFERQLHTSQHPCASRLRPSARLSASTNQTVPVNCNSVRTSSAAHDHTEATSRPLSYPSHNSSGHQTSQGTCEPCCWLSICCRSSSASSPAISRQYSVVLCHSPCILLMQHATSPDKLSFRCWSWRQCSIAD